MGCLDCGQAGRCYCRGRPVTVVKADASSMFLSVIVPCRNAATFIGMQLEALARQRCDRDWEVVVADNGSTDQTRGVVESYRAKLPRLVLMDASELPGAA